MSGVQTIEVGSGEDGLRLDRWFKARFPALTHGRLEKLLRTGQVRVDGGRVKANTRLEAGQVVRVPPLGEAGAPATRKDRPKLNPHDVAFVQSLVIHKDDDVLVLNKPAGLAVQGGTNTTRHLDGLLDALTFRASERPRLVHRLDRDTSGVLVLARSRHAAQALTHAFQQRATRKIYWGVVQKVPKPDHGTVDLPLIKAKGADGDERMRGARKGEADAKRAVTLYATMAQAGQKAAWLALMPVTGRTHQLRAHCEAMGHPLVNDRKYGYGARWPELGNVPKGLHLHARMLTIAHPAGGVLKVSAPLPEHMAQTWALFGFDAEDTLDPFPDEV